MCPQSGDILIGHLDTTFHTARVGCIGCVVATRFDFCAVSFRFIVSVAGCSDSGFCLFDDGDACIVVFGKGEEEGIAGDIIASHDWLEGIVGEEECVIVGTKTCFGDGDGVVFGMGRVSFTGYLRWGSRILKGALGRIRLEVPVEGAFDTGVGCVKGILRVTARTRDAELFDSDVYGSEACCKENTHDYDSQEKCETSLLCVFLHMLLRIKKDALDGKGFGTKYLFPRDCYGNFYFIVSAAVRKRWGSNRSDADGALERG